jgi:hypothetical protein
LCGLEKDEAEFNRRGSDGFQSRCRSCNSEYLKQHYRDNTQYYRDKAKRIRKQILIANYTRLHDYFATHPCVDCGESDPVVLQFDHVRGEKAHTIRHPRPHDGPLVPDRGRDLQVRGEVLELPPAPNR